MLNAIRLDTYAIAKDRFLETAEDTGWRERCVRKVRDPVYFQGFPRTRSRTAAISADAASEVQRG